MIRKSSLSCLWVFEVDIYLKYADKTLPKLPLWDLNLLFLKGHKKSRLYHCLKFIIDVKFWSIIASLFEIQSKHILSKLKTWIWFAHCNYTWWFVSNSLVCSFDHYIWRFLSKCMQLLIDNVFVPWRWAGCPYKIYSRVDTKLIRQNHKASIARIESNKVYWWSGDKSMASFRPDQVQKNGGGKKERSFDLFVQYIYYLPIYCYNSFVGVSSYSRT